MRSVPRRCLQLYHPSLVDSSLYMTCKANRAMSRKVNLLEEITNKKQTWKIFVKVINIWSVMKNQRLNSMEMILMDEKGERIQASVRSNHVQKYGPMLSEGQTYTMQNFEVEADNGDYRVSMHPFKLLFMKSTIVKQTEAPNFPKQVFHFTSFEDILSGKAPLNVLVDIIGEFIGLEQNQNINVHNRTMKKVVINLQDARNTVLNCTLWDHYANQLLSFLETHETGPVVIILTHGKIKDTSGKYPTNVQNTMYSSKLIINADMEEILKFKSNLSASSENSSQRMISLSQCSQLSFKDQFLRGGNIKSLSEIKVLNKECYCLTIAKVDMLYAANGWWFDGCTSCGHKTDFKESKYICPNCAHVDSKSDPKYRIELKISHNKIDAKLVLWDRECIQVLQQSASQLRQQQIEDGDCDPNEIPEAIDVLIGKIFAFKLRVQPGYSHYSASQITDSVNIIQSISEKLGAYKDLTVHVEEDGNAVEQLSLSGMEEFSANCGECLTPAKRNSDEIAIDDSLSQIPSSTEFSTSKFKRHIKTE